MRPLRSGPRYIDLDKFCCIHLLFLDFDDLLRVAVFFLGTNLRTTGSFHAPDSQARAPSPLASPKSAAAAFFIIFQCLWKILHAGEAFADEPGIIICAFGITALRSTPIVFGRYAVILLDTETFGKLTGNLHLSPVMTVLAGFPEPIGRLLVVLSHSVTVTVGVCR